MHQERVSLGSLYNVRKLDLMANPERLRRLVRTVAEKSGANVVGTHIKRYPERGINAIADIGESVVVIQVSPERYYASVLFHYTYDHVDPKKGIDYASYRFGSDPPVISELEGPELPPMIE